MELLSPHSSILAGAVHQCEACTEVSAPDLATAQCASVTFLSIYTSSTSAN